MTEEKVYRKHEIMCEVAEEEGDAFTMTFTAIEMDKPNSFKTGFKDYAELKGLANYILGLAQELKYPTYDITYATEKDYPNIRECVTTMLNKEFGTFIYKGHGANLGVWETEDFQELTKPMGSSFWSGKFRLWVFVPFYQGIQIKIETYLISVYEWETVFEGYIHHIAEIADILNFNLGLKRK